jgi:hypothetical protein
MRNCVPMINKLFVLMFALSALALAQRTYTTNFPATETPLSESHTWINGGTCGDGTLCVGRVWSNVNTTTHLAFGTQSGAVPPPYTDSIALLKGTWGPNQVVSGVVYWNGNPNTDNDYDEVQLGTRMTLANHSWTGYLIDCRVGNSNSGSYIEIGRANGPQNSFGGITDSLTCRGAGCNCVNGDVLTLTTINNASGRPVVSVYKNGVLKARATDTGTPYTNGAPVMSFYHQNTNAANTDFGLSNFAAMDSTEAPRFGARFMEYVWAVADRFRYLRFSRKHIFEGLFVVLLACVGLITVLMATLRRRRARKKLFVDSVRVERSEKQ